MLPRKISTDAVMIKKKVCASLRCSPEVDVRDRFLSRNAPELSDE